MLGRTQRIPQLARDYIRATTEKVEGARLSPSDTGTCEHQGADHTLESEGPM
jgi:hypothetical protein